MNKNRRNNWKKKPLRKSYYTLTVCVSLPDASLVHNHSLGESLGHHCVNLVCDDLQCGVSEAAEH